MTRARREISMLAVLVAALLALASWSYGRMAAHRAAAADAAVALAECQSHQAHIESLRHKPTRVRSQEMQVRELAARLEVAIQQAGLPLDSLIWIRPDGVRRVGDSAYKEQPTQVLLHGLSIEHLVAFLSELSDDDAPPRIAHLRLTTPHGQDEGTRWNIECILSYLIYAPSSPDVDRTARGGR